MYEDVKLKPIATSKLLLDPENPRFHIPTRNQSDLIAELVDNHGVIRLAQQIAKFGFFSNRTTCRCAI